MPRAMREGVSIYYERDGNDDGDPVVFLQDVGAGRWTWRWQREAVADEYEAVAPDSRGTGRSDADLPPLVSRLPGPLRTPLVLKAAGYSVEELAADLEAVLEDASVSGAHLVGAGLGGAVAQQYAVDYSRAATLTLCGTTHGGGDAVPIPDEARDHLVASAGTDRKRIRKRMRPVFTERFTNRNPHLLDRIVEWRREQDASDPAREAQATALLEFDAGDRLDEIRVPTLVVHGTDDRVIPVENGRLLAETLTDSRLELVDGGSHFTFVENATRVNEVLLSFLEERG
ncbi:alpha/beta fold hydrolase [Natronobacterium gregoryi]|uniref:Alpha/beta hydrolase n=2 Tax=Natronobacterium gregoryi TaxID=44930 RepID=L0AHR1_NATGS|nr:alpha/beta hydrolase [Natronobacterium gregoryi]AFZ72687.1 putative hydrolase or acyltransferase of alpha/beta superfamily [Natronobacterium gregoryi SP2]ELY69020.1 alpha/beta hydrolase fold protein [Natronobacterium gregoryi SP2]PLK20639.1 alpha/beta hydrolase [Natronobacterium gregoryi SP2]SFI91702.1 Pimeloyl-ACP methyl ester carboxylesterase [Natronobacterium gregoryi]